MPSRVAADGNEIARLEALLARQAHSHEATLRELGDRQALYTQGIAHDLRAPLRSIDGFAGLLSTHADAGLDGTARSYIARIRSAAARMAGLIDALTELSRVDTAPLADQAVDLSLLVDWALAEHSDADPDRRTEIDVQPGMEARGDERQLRQLIHHLVRNAWVFTAPGEAVRISVTATRHADHMHLSIRDQGLGFDMRYVDKLFQPFQRLHGPEHGGGHGLGLAIASRVVGRHRGRIWAESSPGAGSTFHVELPNRVITP